MSTIVVVKKNGYAAIAADTLISWGGTKISSSYLKEKTKIVKVGDSYLGTTGAAVHQHVIESYFARSENFPFSSTQDIFETWREFHKSLKSDYFINPNDDKDAPYENSHMHVLIANPHGIFGVYALRSVDEYEKFWAFGSGTDYALGALYVLYDRYETAEEVAREGVRAAAEFDNATAAPITSFAVKLLDK